MDPDLVEALSADHESKAIPNKLCSLCESIVTESKHFQGIQNAADETFSHYDDLASLRRSATQGCHLCSLLDASASAFPDRFEEAKTLTVHIGEALDGTPYEVENVRFSIAIGPGSWSSDVYACATETLYEGPTDLQTKQKLIPLSTHTGARDSIDLVKHWLIHCNTEHRNCNLVFYRRELPTRLLHIVEHPLSLRLVFSHNLPPETQYVALSYRWGPRQPGSTFLTGDKVEELMNKVQFNSLPRTLQDAVIVTYRLGLQYLWIDRLCIDQESPLDFETEASKMGTYYLNSAINVAALDSLAAEDGFLGWHNALAIRPCHLQAPGKPNLSIDLYENKIVQTPWCREGRDAASLMTRAWVVQEKMLSPRTVFFGSKGIYWECRETHFSENMPEGPSGLSNDLETTISTKSALFDLLEGVGGNASPLPFPLVWSNIVFQYTCCSLTDASDRWIAIKGIAEVVEKVTGKGTVHGLWQENIALELLWRRDIFEQSNADPNCLLRLTPVAPSWSWASIVGPVRLNHDEETSAPWVQICGAHIIDLPHTNAPGGHTKACKVSLDLPLVKCVLQGDHLDVAGHPKINFYVPDVEIKDGTELWLLALAKNQWDECAGLTLQPYGATKNTWTRCGWFRGIKKIDWPRQQKGDGTHPYTGKDDVPEVLLV